MLDGHRRHLQARCAHQVYADPLLYLGNDQFLLLAERGDDRDRAVILLIHEQVDQMVDNRVGLARRDAPSARGRDDVSDDVGPLNAGSAAWRDRQSPLVGERDQRVPAIEGRAEVPDDVRVTPEMLGKEMSAGPAQMGKAVEQAAL